MPLHISELILNQYRPDSLIREICIRCKQINSLKPSGYHTYCTVHVLDRAATVIGMFLLSNKLHGLSPQANYTDRLIDRRLSAKLVPTLADRGCRVVSATILPQSLISGF
jgi:hypothetical protein